jgi:hypothetical protein
LPVEVGEGAKGEPEFRFQEMDTREQRVYHLLHTVIRRERDQSEISSKVARREKKGKR